MDGRQFDALARHLSSRRTALGGLLGGLFLPLEAAARGKGKSKQRKDKGKDKGSRKGKDKGKTRVQAEECWRAGACIPKKGANVSRCDLAGYRAPPNLDCTGCNLSRANLRDASFVGANLTRANLSGSCLVDAILSGATVTNATNLYNAIFCRTIMPDGSTNNSSCGSGTACCPTCIDTGDACGTGIAGSCCGGGTCLSGICQPCPCTGIGQVCNAQGACVCAAGWKVLANGTCGFSCTTDAQCTAVGCPRCASFPGVCISSFTDIDCNSDLCPAGQVCNVGTCSVVCGPAVS